MVSGASSSVGQFTHTFFLVFLVHHLLPFDNESLLFSSNRFFNHYLLHSLAHPFTLTSSQPWALGLKSLPGGRA